MDKHLEPGIAGDYAEGILDPVARAAAEAHLQGCEDCRLEVAAASAYFRGMSTLEPIKAPENFLANVRARLPGESPWRWTLSVLARPWRVLPLQLALATLIGVTAVSVYVRQGGMEPDTVATTLEPAPTSLSAPAEPAPEPIILSGKDAAATAPAPTSMPVERNKVASLPKARLQKGNSGAGAPGAGIGAVEPEKASEKKSEPSLRLTPQASRRSDPASAFRKDLETLDEDGGSREKPMSQAPPAPVARSREALANSAPAEDKQDMPAQAPMAKAESAPVAQESENDLALSDESYGSLYKEGAGVRPESRAGSKPKAAPVADGKRAVPASAPAAPARQAVLTLRLRALKDTAALMYGLKAMGVSVEVAPAREGEGIRKLLAAPASMGPDLRSYLARYGSLSVSPADGAGAEPSRWDLVLLKP